MKSVSWIFAVSCLCLAGCAKPSNDEPRRSEIIMDVQRQSVAPLKPMEAAEASVVYHNYLRSIGKPLPDSGKEVR